MSAAKLIGVLFIVGGILALIYGGFTYTRHTSTADVGPLHVSVQHRQTVAVPIWAGIGVIVLGSLVIALDGRRN
jgi:TRAP-type C4-dicarboxylate transport system permease small subunit